MCSVRERMCGGQFVHPEMEIQVQDFEVYGGYLRLDGGEVGRRKMPGRMVRLPPKRGAIKKQIFASIGQALAEIFRGGRLSKQSCYEIMAMARMYFCRKVDSNNSSSLLASMKKLLQLDIQNWKANVYS